MQASRQIGKNLVRIDPVDVALLFAGAAVFGVIVTSLNLVTAHGRTSPFTRDFAPLIFLPMMARRYFFGMPERGRMKTGFRWSLAGVLGLVFLIFGLGSFSLGLWSVLGALAPEPDSSAVVAEEMASLPKLPSFEAPMAGESRTAFAKRLAAEDARKQEDDRRFFSESLHTSWVANHEHRLSVGERLLAIGLFLAALGTLLDRARFDRKAVAAPEVLAAI